MQKLLFILLVLSLTGRIGPAEAHFLATDRSIGVVFHAEPGDDPIVNQPATFFFDIKDKQGKFQLDKCDCKVVILGSGSPIASGVVVPVTATEATYTYSFPQKDVYTVELIGVPSSPDQFQSFNLSWDLRVARDGGPSSQNSPFISFLSVHAIHLALVLLGSALVIGQIVKGKK